MIVVVAAVEQLLVDALLGLLDQAFPDGIAFLRRPEAEESEGGVGQAIFGRRLREHLRGDAAGGQVDEVVALEGRLAGGAVIFAEGVRDVAGLVRPRLFARRGQDGAVGLDGFQVVAQH